MNKTFTTVATLIVMLISDPSAAHPIHDELATFVSGAAHPLSNWIHLLSTFIVGFWLGHRSKHLISMILLGGITIGALFLLNITLHIVAMTSFTWLYLLGFLVSTILLLIVGVLASPGIKTMTPTLFNSKTGQD